MSLLEPVARLAGNVGRMLRRAWLWAAVPRRGGFWLDLRLTPPLAEQRLPGFGLGREPGLSLLELLQALERAARDPQVVGVLLRFEGAPQGFARALALRRAVDAVRATGKPVAAWGATLGTAELLAASGASRLWLPESGALLLVGLRAEGLFLHGLLERLGVRPEVLRVGSHKTGAETLTRESMSPEQREQTEALLDDLYEQLVAAVAGGRGLDPAAVRACIDRGPFTAPAAAEAGLIDACLYPDEIDAALEALAPTPPPEGPGAHRVRRVAGSTYWALRARDTAWRPLWRGLPRLAYVVAAGPIWHGSGLRGVASERLRGLLERLGEDEGVAGVVLRLDSPGGDGVASDLLWRAVQQLRQEKPVVVSMGEVAASGGYFLAAAADAVFAEASTLTGSIGVLGGKLNLEAIYERVGVRKEAVERGARAGMLSETRGFTPDERGALREQMQSLYERFVRKVAEGRHLEVSAVERVAQGRVWSGRRAQGLGLVDALGGPLEALRELRRRAGLAEDERALVEVHPRPPRWAGLRALAGLVLGPGMG